jgi:hypothetical protein
MKFRRNLSNSLSRSEIINRAESFGTSTRAVIWRRSCPLIGFVLCSIGVFLALAGLSKSVAENPAATSAETQDTLFSLTTDNDNAPSARVGMGMAYDAGREEVVLFGGVGVYGTPHLGDTWVWDGTTWTQRFPATSPSARESTMTYDAARGRLVLFGGRGDTAVLNDTWTWDGTTWTEQHPSTVPPIRVAPGLAYDAQRGEVVMFGGYQGCSGCDLDDTWTWDGVTWTQESPTRSPSGRDGMGMVYDALRGEVVLFGGTVFPTVYNDTWTWDGSNWQRESPPAKPLARTFPAMAYDEVRGNAVIFGGGSISGYFDDTWEWGGTTWTQRFPATSPSARIGPAMTYDAARGRLVLFGGGTFDGTLLQDTWTWDGTTWLLQAPTVALSDISLTFGAQLVNTRSGAQTATLTNTGTTTLTISSIAASGDFVQKNNCGSSLTPGASCTIKVAFGPSTKGIRTGNVTITDNAADSPQTIALTGTGTVVQASPSGLDFGDQVVGTTSDSQTATITNTGRAVLRIFGVGISGPNFGDFAATTTCGSRLAAGGSCTIDVTFTPGARGDRHADLKIADDGGASPQAVSLTGTGVLQ